jgi:preprotein translocase subunit SecG
MLTGFLSVLYVLVAILLTLVVLVQRGRGGGLSGAFGSGGGSSSAFGTKTGDVFTWATVILFAVFMLLAIWLNLRLPEVKEDYGSSVIKPTTVPAATGAPVTPQPPAPLPPVPQPHAPEPVAPVTPVAPAPAAPAAPAATTAPATSTTQPK